MVLVGFAYLMAFLRRHRFGSLTYTLLITVFCMQWGVLCNAVFLELLPFGEMASGTVNVSMGALLNGMFTSAAVLISFGAWIGKVNGEMLCILVFFECILQAVNNYICTTLLSINDMGGTIVIHCFGAYFGLGATLMLTPKNVRERAGLAGSSYDSDTFSLLATFFLWIYWPSFNAATVTGPGKTLALINTVLCLVASGFTAVAASRLIRKSNKFTMEDLENSTLAGGVMMGATASISRLPGTAIAMGIVAGFISVLGYARIAPFLQKKIGLYDTAGINNLHGMPSLLGGLASVLIIGLTNGSGNWGLQLAGLAVTLSLALVSGLILGWIVHTIPIGKPKRLFDDEENFALSVLCNHAPRCGHKECGHSDTRTTMLDLSHLVKQIPVIQ